MFIRTADVTVALTFPPGTEGADEKLVMPGDNVEMIGDLVHDIALEKGSRFTLREGGKTIGTGLITECVSSSSSWYSSADTHLASSLSGSTRHPSKCAREVTVTSRKEYTSN